MFPSDSMQRLFENAPAAELSAVADLFARGAPAEERTAAIRALLKAGGSRWREDVGDWVAGLLSVETLVPEPFKSWRPLVRDAMAFVASRFSDSRLAPKLVEQIDLPEATTVETRLGRIIAKTPGLQKLGQVLARTRRLSPELRRELQTLENGIADIGVEEIRAIILRELGACMDVYRVQLATELLSEASVSAILPFTWLNPVTGKQEEGVFKVIKPHVPECYAEDLQLLQSLAAYLAARHDVYGFRSREVIDTLDEVRLLLESEVDFRREQATLAEVKRVYRRGSSHAPKPIPELCTDCVTAMSLERGVKVTEACRNSPFERRRIASGIVEALLADPMFSTEDNAVFHADPHAGNLLYNPRSRQLIPLDWALTARLSREDRRQLGRLMVLMSFRDISGVRQAIHNLSRRTGPEGERDAAVIDRCVDKFFAELPHASSLGAIDAMRLLESIGVEGVRFPGALVLIRKVLFTLDGVLYDITGGDVRIDTIVARVFASRLFRSCGTLSAPFTGRDLMDIQASALRYASGLWAVAG